jgi:Ca2+-binding EF-hand superfamily protein
MTFLANNLPNSDQLDFSALRRVFKSIDKQNTGYLSTHDMESALKQMNIPEAEIKDIFKSLVGNTEEKINYSLFLAATIDHRKTLTL